MAVHGTLTVVIAFLLTSLSTIVVGLRFYSRYFLVGKLSSPDWMMLFALICTWGSAVVNYYQVHFMDYTRAYESKEAYAEIVTGSLLTWYIYRIFYLMDLCFIKLSILLFYNYVASSHKSFHRIVKALLIIVIVSTFGMLIAAILACNPPADAWSFDVFWGNFTGNYSTQCYNPTILWFCSAVFNLVTDCFIWVLPIPFVLHLQTMPAKTRLQLAGIFSIGIIAIAASAVRLWVLTEWTSGFIKQGMNTGNLLIWGQVEQHAAIIAASIPFLRPLLRKMTLQRQERHSPSPAAKFIAPELTPDGHLGHPGHPRTPIIPSPSPTFDSSNTPFKVPPSPLSPISPVQPELLIGTAL